MAPDSGLVAGGVSKGKGKGKGKNKEKNKGKGKHCEKGKEINKIGVFGNVAKTPDAEVAAGPPDPSAPCKFFGSAKGCGNAECPFSHEQPNSVPPCSFKQRTGQCERGDACTYRHVPWASADQARQHYASRENNAVEVSTQRYKELHRDNSSGNNVPGGGHNSTRVGSSSSSAVPLVEKIKPEQIDDIVEREIQLDTYGSKALKMMEKMGYQRGGGLGKSEQGRTQLLRSAIDLERASQSAQLGLGLFTGGARSTLNERSAKIADIRSHKQRKIQEVGYKQHNLLSSDESSEGEENLVHKSRDTKLKNVAK